MHNDITPVILNGNVEAARKVGASVTSEIETVVTFDHKTVPASINNKAPQEQANCNLPSIMNIQHSEKICYRGHDGNFVFSENKTENNVTAVEKITSVTTVGVDTVDNLDKFENITNVDASIQEVAIEAVTPSSDQQNERDAHGFRIASQNKEAEIPLASFSSLAEVSLSVEQFASPNFTYGTPPSQGRSEQVLHSTTSIPEYPYPSETLITPGSELRPSLQLQSAQLPQVCDNMNYVNLDISTTSWMKQLGITSNENFERELSNC
ncbi:hypothetical protein EAI_12087 [Harpegnathos saltator]|uniref:Uncharacterized protein n=1 Tax=Harpegnathos saltator TaxID=610380 RepID=E2BR10_HARSA|nr:hypothetical protein EAI_12087 [Harpegnathos saltator]